MHVEFLLIGQGICGSLLGYELKKANRSFLVIDELNTFSASRVASGIINPVTGRRIVKTWMIDELLPFAQQRYQELGKELQTAVVTETSTIDFFPTAQMMLAFKKRCEEGEHYLQLPEEDKDWNEFFLFHFGYGTISPCLLIDIHALLKAIRVQLLASGNLLAEKFEIANLLLTTRGVRYRDISAGKIIFCDGIQSFDNPFFRLLPFAPNKGELLIAEIDGLPRDSIFKYGSAIVPWKENLFWIGASHEWKFDNDQPTNSYREHIVNQLKKSLKLPFKIVDHLAAVRPATLERRPFIGLHPLHPQVGIFNGMGTKGCSLAPYFAKQFCEFLINDLPLMPEVDISRFTSVLSRL